MSIKNGAASMKSLAPKLGASLLIAVSFVLVLRRGGLPILPTPAALAHLDLGSVALYAGLYCLATFLRTYRWIYLLRPMRPELSAKRVLGIGFIGFTAVLFAPLRAGEMVRPWLLAQDGEIGFVQATGTVAAERIVDGLLLTALLMVGLLSSTPLSPLPTHLGQLPLPLSAVQNAARLSLVAFTGAFLAMALFHRYRDAMARLVQAVVGLVSQELARFVTNTLQRLADGFGFLPSRQHGLAFLRDTLAYWAVCALSFFALMRGVGVPASFTVACVTMGIMGIGSLIPSGPGFFGTYQLSGYCALAMFFPESTVLGPGAVFTFTSYVTQLVVTAISCLIGFWLMRETDGERKERAA